VEDTLSNIPVNANNLSIDPLTVLGGEETNNAGNVDWLANTVMWRPCSGVNVNLVVVHLLSSWNVLLADSVVHVGLDTTWGNAVDSDLLVTSIDGHASDEGLDGTLGGRVHSVLWNTLGLTSDRSHEDDTAANLEVLVCLPGNEELTSSVDVENAIKFLWCHILEMSKGDDAGVGADDVEFAEVGLGLLEHRHDLVDVGNVGLDGNGLAAHLDDLVYNRLSSLSAVGVVDNNIGTTSGKVKSHCLSDTTAGTSDEGDLALQAP